MRVIFAIFTIFWFNYIYSQNEPYILEHVCQIDDAPISSTEISTDIINSSDNTLFSYLKEIKQVLFMDETPIGIRYLNTRKTACALNRRISSNRIESIIAINQQYYSSKVSTELQKPMFIWILGHEIAHHQHRDYNNTEYNTLKAVYNELSADELGGYLIGKLSDLPFESIETILKAILRDEGENFKYHPPLDYRICAAKAGWIKAKSGNLTSGSVNYLKAAINVSTTPGNRWISLTHNDIKNNFKITSFYQSENITYSNLKYSDHYGPGIHFDKKNDTIRSIYLGNYSAGKFSGNGIYINYDRISKGTFIDGNLEGYCIQTYFPSNDKYEGEFKNWQRNGFGKYTWRSGQVYIGNWLDSYRHGYGIQYKITETKVIDNQIKKCCIDYEGCWEKDKQVPDSKNCTFNEK